MQRAVDKHVVFEGVAKHYGGVAAVKDVSFEIARGQVHALVGENGAGKSTLAKILAGVVRRDSGELIVDGESVDFSSPRQALEAGIAIIDQELALVPSRTVMTNVLLAVESSRVGVVDVADQRRRFAELIERTSFDVDRDAKVGSLSVAEQQKVEILRAIARDARLIIMDEPTARLTQVESEQLYAIIRSLCEDGVTVLYISHFLEEVLEVSNTVTVMRDGLHVRTRPSAEETESSLVTAMLGRSLDLAFPDRRPVDKTVEPVLEVRDLHAEGRFSEISFALRPGEIVGLAGLIGSGRTEVLRAIFAADRIDSGEILLDGSRARWRSPRDAIAAGVAMLPESRKDDGLAMGRSISENIVITNIRKVSAWGLVRRGRERGNVDRLVEDLDVRTASAAAPIASLSGGNQQKVLFAKFLMTAPRVFLIDEPTRGVDVGAKRAIYELVVKLAAEGMAVLLVSSELEEVLGLAHRVLVMRLGRIAAELAIDDCDEETVLAAAFGTSAA